jgi:WD40 repeat protein
MPGAARRVGRYELIRRLGRGGMGVVYLARDRHDGHEVALKELAFGLADEPAAMRRFAREADLIGSLRHPSIVGAHEFFWHDDAPFIAMEYLPAGSLRPRVGRLSPAAAAVVLDGVLAGLAHAHARGIVHRDLKPENLLFADDGTVKIADFGVAKALADATLSAPSGLLGSPAYLAPEQVAGGEVGPWTDLYSVGVIAYELFTGRPPFGGEAVSELLWHHINAPVPESGVPPALEAWLLRLLAKEPRERPHDAVAVAADLRAISAGGTGWWTAAPGVQARPAPRAATVVTPAARRRPRRLRLALLGTAAALALALGVVLVLNERDAARAEAQAAEAERLGTLALAEGSLARALLLAREAVALDDTPATRGNLLSALVRSPAVVGVLHGDGAPLTAIDVSPDGRHVAAGDEHGRVIVFDARTRRRAGAAYRFGREPILDLRYSPDGTRLAIHNGFTLQLVDPRTRQVVEDVETGSHAVFSRAEPLPTARLTFSPDSRVLAAAASVERGDRAPIWHWDAATGRQLTRPPAVPRGLAAMLPGSEQLVLSGTSTTRIVEARTLRATERFRLRGGPTVSSRDERLVAIGTPAGELQLLDLATGTARTADGAAHRGAIWALAFSADARTLVTVGADQRLIVWDVRSARPVETLALPGEAFTAVAISPDGRTAYSADRDGTALVLDLEGERRLSRRLQGAGFPTAAPQAVGDTAYTRSKVDDGELELVDVRTGAVVERIDARRHGGFGGIAIAPGMLALATERGQVTLWDRRSRRPRPSSPGATWPAAFSPDGRFVATRAAPADVTVSDLASDATLGQAHLTDAPFELAVSPGGQLVAAVLVSGGVEIATVGRGAPRRLPIAGRGLRFSGDGRKLLMLDEAGRAWRFDTRTWKASGAPLGTGALTMDISPRGNVIATTSLGGATRLWDAASGRPLGSPLPGAPGRPAVTGFANGGTHLVVLDDFGDGYVWDLRASAWLRHACTVAGRFLTREEWRSALGDTPYAPACRDAR